MKILCLIIDCVPQVEWRETYEVHRRAWNQCLDRCPIVDGYFLYADPDLAEDYRVELRRFTVRGSERYDTILYKTQKAIEVLLADHDYVVRTNISSLYDFPLLERQPLPRSGLYTGHVNDGRYVSGSGMVLSNDVAKRLAIPTEQKLDGWDDIAIAQILGANGIAPQHRESFYYDYSKDLEQVTTGRHFHYRLRDTSDLQRVKERAVTEHVVSELYPETKNRQGRKGRASRVVYTAITNGHARLSARPDVPDTDFVCYSDFPLERDDWDIRPIEAPQQLSSRMRAKFHKLFPPEGYEWNVWVDGAYVLRTDEGASRLVDDLIAHSPSGFGLHRHDKRDCLFDEAKHSVQLDKCWDQHRIIEDQNIFDDPVHGGAAIKLYRRAVEAPSDINEHLGRLRQLGERCRHVTEFGVRSGASTTAWVAAQPVKLVCYDIRRSAEVDAIERAAREIGIAFVFNQQDVLTATIEPTDLLFIDTLHTYDQLRAELTRHADRVRSMIVLHDTETFGQVGELPGTRGLWPAVEEFLSAKREWRLFERRSNNNGLAILAHERFVP